MKFDIEVEVDWLHESSVDETVKDSIIHGIVSRIKEDVKEDIERKATEKFEDQFNQIIGKKITETYDQMMGEEIRVTDEWGDTKEKGTIKDLIKKRFENAMQTKVDDRGKPTNYNSVGTRREYLIQKRVDSVIDEKVKELSKHIDENINQRLEENLKTEIGEKLFKTLELEKFIKREEK